MGPNNKEYNMCYVCIGMLKGDYFFLGGGCLQNPNIY